MVQFASYLRRVLCKTRLIFPRINGPNVDRHWCEKMPRRRRQRERQKKQKQKNRLNRQNNNSVRASLFLVHFFAVTARIRRETS